MNYNSSYYTPWYNIFFHILIIAQETWREINWFENNELKVCPDLGPQKTAENAMFVFQLEECFCLGKNYAPAKYMRKYYGAMQIKYRFSKEIMNLKRILLLAGHLKCYSTH